LCDTFGPRFPGTAGLTNALNWIASTMQSQGLENVKKEPVNNIATWIRGSETLYMLQPRVAKLEFLGLGRSVGGTVSSEAVVVANFDELRALGPLVKNKIVVYNAPFVTYGQTVIYRTTGASEAAKLGAVAALIRSIAPFSLNSPHTGAMRYEAGVPQIPAACITIEDAEMLARMYARNQTIVLSLHMDAVAGPIITSYNILAEVVGRVNPEQVVLMGGHSDSWDVGTGAIDDGGGFYSAWESLRIIHNLVTTGRLQRPRRTIRVIGWVDEEMNQRGANSYAADHLAELPNHIIAIESDSGNFQPTGFGFTGVPAAKVLLQQIGPLIGSIGAGNITDGGADTDNGVLQPYGVPLGSLKSAGAPGEADNYYFYFHHSNADTITHINKQGLKNSVAGLGIMTYVLADMEQRLPNQS